MFLLISYTLIMNNLLKMSKQYEKHVFKTEFNCLDFKIKITIILSASFSGVKVFVTRWQHEIRFSSAASGIEDFQMFFTALSE